MGVPTEVSLLVFKNFRDLSLFLGMHLFTKVNFVVKECPVTLFLLLRENIFTCLLLAFVMILKQGANVLSTYLGTVWIRFLPYCLKAAII